MKDIPPIQIVFQKDLYKIYVDPHDGHITVLFFMGCQTRWPEVMELEECPAAVQSQLKKQAHV